MERRQVTNQSRFMISSHTRFLYAVVCFLRLPLPAVKPDCGIVTAIGIYRQLSGEKALSWKNITPVPKESRVTSNWAAVSQLSQFGSLPPSKSSSFSTGFSTLVG